jgi:ADP-heptose:LPS heptosyltransferase
MKHRPKILVLRQLGGVGDVLAMSCVYKGLREKYPTHEIHLLTSKLYMAGSLVDIASHNPYIDAIHLYEPHLITTERTKYYWGKYFPNAEDIEADSFWQSADIAIDLNWVAWPMKTQQC